MTLTVVIPTLNEEEDLPRTLKSVNFADEILVIDSGSTDQTIPLAKKFNARIINYPLKSFSDSRNFADSQAKSDWILSIEADVVVPPELGREIKKTILTPQPETLKTKAFYLGRINIIWNKPILHTDWGPNDDCHLRLYQKGSGQWQSKVHEQFVTKQPTSKLKNFLHHYNYQTVSEFINKTNTYSELAQKKPSFSLWLAPLKDFFKRYFYKLGFLDGYHGLFLSYLQAVYHLNVLVKSKTN